MDKMTDQEREKVQKLVDTFVIWTVKLAIAFTIGYFVFWLFGGIK